MYGLVLGGEQVPDKVVRMLSAPGDSSDARTRKVEPLRLISAVLETTDFKTAGDFVNFRLGVSKQNTR